jgi:hypothetical protein
MRKVSLKTLVASPPYIYVVYKYRLNAFYIPDTKDTSKNMELIFYGQGVSKWKSK